MAGSALRLLRKERLAALGDPDVAERAIESIVETISSGGDYGDICVEHGLSWTDLLMWLQEDQKRWNHFRKAHEARGWLYGEKAAGVVDEVSAETVEVDKFRFSGYMKLAEKLAPEVWGKMVRHEHSAVGDLGERLRRARERVIEPAAPQPDETANAETPRDQQTDSVAVPNQGAAGVDNTERRG